MGNTNELTTKTKTVSMMSLQKDYIANIGKGLEDILGSMSSYQALCGYNVLNKINTLLAAEGLNHTSQEVDKTSINDAIKFAVCYQLNTDNNEIFVMIRGKKFKQSNGVEVWKKTIECKPQYKGQLKIIANYGRNVKRVYPEWIVRENDKFTYPMMKGVEMIPPTWEKKDNEGKIVRVVVPVEYTDGYIDYRIAERESIAVNIKAQVNQALLGVKDKDEVARIKALMKDKTLDQLLNDPLLLNYINETYKGISSEEMIITKLVINATKRVAIDYQSAFTRELLEKTYDNSDVYTKNHNAEKLLENEQRQIEMVETENQPVEQEVKEIKESKIESKPVEEEKSYQSLDDLFGDDEEPF